MSVLVNSPLSLRRPAAAAAVKIALPTAARYRLSVSEVADQAAIDDLRISAYRSASYFELKDTTHLRVDEDPADSVVFCAWDGKELAATLRLACAEDSGAAEELLGFELPQRAALPAAVFSRGAVNPNYRGQGWMPFLLTLGIRASRQLGLACALGAQATGTPHQKAMLQAGWSVRDVGPMSHEALDMRTTAQFLWLDASGFDRAVVHGFSKAEGLLAECEVRSLAELAGLVVSRLGRRAPQGPGALDKRPTAQPAV